MGGKKRERERKKKRFHEFKKQLGAEKKVVFVWEKGGLFFFVGGRKNPLYLRAGSGIIKLKTVANPILPSAGGRNTGKQR